MPRTVPYDHPRSFVRVPFTRGRCCAWGSKYKLISCQPLLQVASQTMRSRLKACAIDCGTSLHVGCSCHALSPRPGTSQYRELKISFRAVEIVNAATLSHAAQIGHMLALHSPRWQHHWRQSTSSLTPRYGCRRACRSRYVFARHTFYMRGFVLLEPQYCHRRCWQW